MANAISASLDASQRGAGDCDEHSGGPVADEAQGWDDRPEVLPGVG